ncbi:MAG: putative bifunctional diguanylate cyclase/phosphodiesterase [Burkholderiales bacterium]
MKFAVSGKFLAGLVAAAVVLAGNSVISYQAMDSVVLTSGSVENDLQSLERLKRIRTSLDALESAHRSYILRGNTIHLRQAQEELSEARVALGELEKFAGAGLDVKGLRDFGGLIGTASERYRKIEEIHGARGEAAALKEVRSNTNARLLDRMFEQLAAMTKAEEAVLLQRTAQVRENFGVSKASTYVATGFNIALLCFVFYLVHREVRKRRQAEEVLRFSATHDPLTGLPNRLLFSERFEDAIRQARAAQERVAVLFLDLDRFKNINDTLGHEAGDRLLKEVGSRLAACTNGTAMVARQGGDEFVVLMGKLGSLKSVNIVCDKILAEVTKPMALEGGEFHVTASIGISVYPVHGEDSQTLLKHADIAMYRAKELGKNTYQFYTKHINEHSFERLELESALRHALSRDELSLHYQPKADPRTGKIVGLEALLRWKHPEFGMVPPDKIIPLAEETGLIVDIGAWAIRTACLHRRAWQDMGLPPLRVAVNLSARQFVQASLLNDVRDSLARAQIEAHWLELEITESTVMHDPDQAMKLLGEFKKMGVHLTVDDFGTGYSSLAYLKRLPLDCVKIDRSFIRGVPGDASDCAIARTIINMAHSLQLTVVAEGVENFAQAEFLVQQGCDEVQGYYYSKPLSEEDLVDYLLNEGNQTGARKTPHKKPALQAI